MPGYGLVVDTIVRHTVRGDLAALASFPMRPFFGGYRVAGPWATGEEDQGMLMLWHSVSCDLGRGEIEAECVRSGIGYVCADTEHVYSETATHDSDGAIKRGASLSGSAYVPVRCHGGGELGKVVLVSRKWCNHGATICEDCAEQWEIDHAVLYSDTKGGRTLAARRDEARTRLPGWPPSE